MILNADQRAIFVVYRHPAEALAVIPSNDLARIIGSAISLDFSNWLTVFLKAALAKSGVPLLSLISGYLAIYSLEKYGY
ncbi:MAG: hypothetical protein V3S21_01640, partial [Xanthomonadales bacterium]